MNKDLLYLNKVIVCQICGVSLLFKDAGRKLWKPKRSYDYEKIEGCIVCINSLYIDDSFPSAFYKLGGIEEFGQSKNRTNALGNLLKDAHYAEWAINSTGHFATSDVFVDTSMPQDALVAHKKWIQKYNDCYTKIVLLDEGFDVDEVLGL